MTNRDEEALIKTADFQQKQLKLSLLQLSSSLKCLRCMMRMARLLKMFKTQQEAVNYSNQLDYKTMVFDKDKQSYLYPKNNFEVYHGSNGLINALPTKKQQLNFLRLGRILVLFLWIMAGRFGQII